MIPYLAMHLTEEGLETGYYKILMIKSGLIARILEVGEVF